MHAQRIPSSQLGAAEWQRARGHVLAAALRAGTHDEASIIMALSDDKATLWLGERSAIVSEVIDYPLCRYHRLWLAGGDLNELLLMEAELGQEAKRIGCARQGLDGRLGWRRALAPLGYKDATMVLHRDLSP